MAGLDGPCMMAVNHEHRAPGELDFGFLGQSGQDVLLTGRPFGHRIVVAAHSQHQSLPRTQLVEYAGTTHVTRMQGIVATGDGVGDTWFQQPVGIPEYGDPQCQNAAPMLARSDLLRRPSSGE